MKQSLLEYGAAEEVVYWADKERGRRRAQIVLDDESLPLLHDWPTAFVHYVGYWALYDSTVECSGWPFPMTMTCNQIAIVARPRDLLVKWAHPGDLFVLPTPHDREQFDLIGIVASIEGMYPTAREEDWVFECITLEGQLCAAEGKEAGEQRFVQRQLRRFNTHVGDRFIRWAELDTR
jgi:hypothetical protein